MKYFFYIPKSSENYIFAYSTIKWGCEKVAKDFSDFVLTKKMSPSHAIKAALSNVPKYCYRAIEKGWFIPDNRIGSISSKLDFYIRKVLNKDVSILKVVAFAENIMQCSQNKKDYSYRIGTFEEEKILLS